MRARHGRQGVTKDDLLTPDSKERGGNLKRHRGKLIWKEVGARSSGDPLSTSADRPPAS